MMMMMMTVLRLHGVLIYKQKQFAINKPMFLTSDAEGPAIYCPSNQTMDTNSSQSTAVAVWNDLQTNDNSAKSLSVMCSHESGSQFQIGHTEVVCEARDASGNQANCTFIIEVIGKRENLTILC